MSNIVKFELRKLFRSPVLWFCVLALIMGNLMNVVVYKMLEIMPIDMTVTDDMGLGLESILTLKTNGTNMLMNSIMNSSLISVLSIFSALFICEDFSNNTAKNILARGYTRKEMVWSKLVSTTIASISFILFSLITGFFFGWLIGGSIGEWSNSLLLYMVGQIVAVIAFNAIYMSVSLMLRKAAPTIAITLLSSSFIPLILKGLSSVFEIKGFDLEMASLSNAVMATMSTTYNGDTLQTVLICSAVYLLIGVASCFFVFRKKDI